jgi:hypothetical protein
MNEQAPQKRDGHLVIYWAWPLLIGLGLAVVLSVSIGGIVLIASADLRTSGKVTGYVFFGVLGAATLFMVLYVVKEWAGTRTVEETRQTVRWEEIEPTVVENTPRPIVIAPRRPQLTAPAPTYPMLTEGANRATIRSAVKALIAKVATRPGTTYPSTAEDILPEPQAPKWVVEFYRVLCAMWGKPLTRRSFEDAFAEGGQGLYYKYVGRSDGTRKDRGLWQNWRIITQTGPRGSWEFCHDLQTILRSNGDLWAYAQEMQHSPIVGRSPNRERVHANQTKPNHVTKPETRGASDG